MTIDPVQYARRWKTLGVLSLSLVIIGLDNTILNVALPTLQHEFDASASKLQWMVDSYLLVFAGLLLVFGVLGDRFGRKRALQAGVSIFGLASLGALVADSADQVIAVRAAMGVGAALIMPATLSIIANLFTGKERGKAIAIWAALAAVGIGLGPLTGGLLLEWFDWSSVFMVNVPFAAAALLLGIRYVPESRDPRPGSFDLLGAALSTAGFSVLVYAIIEAPAHGWTSAAHRSGSLAACRRAARRLPVVGASHRGADARPRLLPQRQLQRRHRGSQRRLLRLARRDLRADPVPAVRHGYSAIEAGAIMSPMALGLMMGAGSSSKAVGRLGVSRVVAVGLTGLAIMLALTALWEPTDRHARAAAGSSALPWRWAGSWHPPLTRSSARCRRPSRASPRRPTPSHAWSPERSAWPCIGSLDQFALLERPRRLADGLPAEAQARGRGLDRRRQRDRRATPRDAASDLLATTGDAFTQAMGTGLLIAAALAAVTAVVVLRFLPPREAAAAPAGRRRARRPSVHRRGPRVPRSATAELKGAADVIHETLEQSCGTHGSVERSPSEDRDLRLARLRRRCPLSSGSPPARSS